MKKGKKTITGFPKVRRILEGYALVEEWGDAPANFGGLPLRNGEYTVIVDPHTGRGLYLVANMKDSIRCTSYLDGVKFKGDFKMVTLRELNERAKETEKFL